MEAKSRRRLIFLGVFFLLVGCYLAIRLYYLQVVENVAWAHQAVNQRSDGLALYRQRGAILDYQGNPLTERDHRPYLAIFPALLTTEEQKAIRPLLAADQVWREGDECSPVTIAEPSAALLRYVSERPMTGVTFCTVPLRYGIKPIAHHLLGYVHPASGKGLAGLEAVYEKDLTSGQMINLAVMTDALRRPIPGLGWRYQEETGTRPGSNLVLTLDLALQSKVEELLDAARVRKGAVVIMEVGTGKVRAMASRPVFDPYAPQQSLQDPDRPLQNRALTAYPPGPLLNPIIMAAALESGKFHPEQIFYDTEAGHGLVTMTQAFAYACPAVFREVVSALGGKSVSAMAKNCGFGTATGWEIPGEESGSGITVTPVQIAAAFQVVACNGNYYPPVVVEGLQGADGKAEPLVSAGSSPGRPALAGSTVAALQEMLEANVLYGTGQQAQIRQGVAGLGGIVISGQVRDDAKDHSWFGGYAPVAAPRFVGVIFLEDVPDRADAAATLFAAIMGECLGR